MRITFAVMAMMALLCVLMTANTQVAHADELRTGGLQSQGASNLALGDLVYFGRYFQKSVSDEELFNKIEEAEPQTVSGKTCWEVSGVRYADAKHQDDDGYSYWYYFGEEPLRWYVLENSGNTYTLISEKVIDTYLFYSIYDGIDLFWGDSTVRRWLNSDFLNLAFTADEQRDIVTSSILHDVSGGGYPYGKGVEPDFVATDDKVYLIDGFEIENGIFSNSGVPVLAKATPYVDLKEQYWSYWLRGGCAYSYGNLYAAGVSYNGEIQTFIPTAARGIRPVIRVNKSAAGLSVQKSAPQVCYKLSFNAQGGKASKTSKSIEVGKAYGTLPTAQRSGYSFLGWYTKASGGSKVSASTVLKNGGNMTVYAHWKAVSYKVTFNGNGGTLSKKSVSVKSGAKIGKLPTASRKNYFFLGWFTKKSGGTQVTSNTKITKAQTLYAHWAKADLKKATITVKSATWTGKALKPAVTVKFKGSTLKAGTHYTLKYSNNKEPGKGKVTLTGKGVFVKSKKISKSFTIAKAAQTISGIANKTYNSGKWKKGETLPFKPKAKESAKLTYSTSNANVVKKENNKLKLVGPGVATITVKAAATKHYKAATKKITVTLKASQQQAQKGITVGSALLKYDEKNKVYLLSGDVFQRSIGVKAQDGAAVTCMVEQSGAGNQPWFESGDKLTAKGTGDFKVLISAKATKAYPASTKTITVRMTGTKLLSNNYTYKQTSSSELTLLKYVGNAANVTVPNTYEFQTTVKPKKVTAIGDGIFSKTAVKSVIFADGSVASIGKNAFANCTALEKVRLPIGLASLGSGAFKGCSKLSDVVLPDKIKELGASAFEGCNRIQGTFYLPNSLTTIGERAFYNCGIKKLIVYNYVKAISANAFNGCAGLTDVYYSASRERWANISVASGNAPLTKATKHFNAAGPTSAYSASKITDEMLYQSYPGYLMNPSYASVCNTLEGDFTEILYSMSDLDISLAALKEQMATGGITYTLKAMIQFYVNTEAYLEDGSTWEEQKLQKALALELIQEVSEGTEVVEVRDQLVKELNSIKGVADRFESAGDKVLKDESTMTSFASMLADVTPYSSADIYYMLSSIERHWDQDDDKTRNWTIKGVYSAAGETINAVNFACTFIIMNEYYRENINCIMSYLPQDSSLYMGFKQLDSMMNHGLETYVKEFLQKKVVEKMPKYASNLLMKELIGASKGVLSAAGAFFEIASFAIDAPSIDSLNKAWLSTTNTLLLHNVVSDLNSTIAGAAVSDRPSYMGDHRLVCSMYFASLKATGKYVIAVQKNKSIYEVPVAKDTAYMTQKLNRYSPNLSYAAYIRSCKELAAEG